MALAIKIGDCMIAKNRSDKQGNHKLTRKYEKVASKLKKIIKMGNYLQVLHAIMKQMSQQPIRGTILWSAISSKMTGLTEMLNLEFSLNRERIDNVKR